MEIELEPDILKNESKQEEIEMTKQMPSSSSSPAHEFSFNISLQSSSTPADEIFFHGHLLPLHLLQNLPISPRSSTTSIDGSSLPIIKDQIIDQPNHSKINGCICTSCDINKNRGHSFNSYEYTTKRIQDHLELPSKARTKAKSFSLFGLAKRRKEEGEKKTRFHMTHFLKKYVKIFSKGRSEDIHFRKQPYSFSGKLSPREGCRRDLRGEFSAPASMRTSPTNSGVLSAMKKVNSPPSNDSTMEELQAAIQAAIAHCKDSNAAAAEKLKS